jgi:hypothetical protein
MQENEYQPGVCNINEIEIKRRWAAAYVGLAIYLVVVAVCVVYVDNYLVRLVAFFPALMASTGLCPGSLEVLRGIRVCREGKCRA